MHIPPRDIPPPAPSPRACLAAAPAPAEAATEVGLDLDRDGALWTPAPPATLIRPMAVALVLVAGAAGFVWGPEFAAWFAAHWG